MKPSPYLSIMHVLGFFLVLTLFANCKKDSMSTDPSQLPAELTVSSPGDNLAALSSGLTQTKTASLFNNWGEAIFDNWFQAGAQYFSADDNSYAYSKKISSGRGSLALLLQDFQFDIPSDATVENIVVAARRFKTGKGSITDYFATLVTPIGPNNKAFYGVYFTNPNFYPGIETEVLYSQNGTGNNGGYNGQGSYQWTPAMINDAAFGVRIDNSKPNGSVVIYYDLVQVTVQYSTP